ncbi:MAG: acyltransferase family protein [Flavobacteriia bacterium]|jgi:peptidoglycan/LPS O-acetylase OafA/YrhL
MSLNEKNEIQSVTMLRGIASLAVCFMHFTGTVNYPTLQKIGLFGGYGVHLFFVISGFIIPYSLFQSKYQLKNFFQFILKRIVRLDPPYIFTIIGIILLSYVAQYSTYNKSEIINFFNMNSVFHLFYLVDFVDGKWLSPVFWSLAIEFQFYLLMGVLFPFISMRKNSLRLLLFFVFCLVPFLFPQDYIVSKYLILFLPGILLFLYKTKEISNVLFVVLVSISIILSSLKFSIAGFICPVLAITVILFLKNTFTFFMFLGKISYSLYLIHTPIGTDGFIQFFQNYISSDLGRLILMLATFPFTIFCAWIFNMTIERPTLNLSKKIIFK